MRFVLDLLGCVGVVRNRSLVANGVLHTLPALTELSFPDPLLRGGVYYLGHHIFLWQSPTSCTCHNRRETCVFHFSSIHRQHKRCSAFLLIFFTHSLEASKRWQWPAASASLDRTPYDQRRLATAGRSRASRRKSLIVYNLI